MLRDARLPAREFLPIVLNNIRGEDDIGVVQNLLAQAWAALITDRWLPLAMIRSIMRGFHQADQGALLAPYVQPYFEALAQVWKERDIEVALAFARGMYPNVVVGEDVINRSAIALNQDTTPGPIRRILLEGRDQMERTIRGRALDAAAWKTAPSST